jgi:hypothetical protein
MEQSDAAGMMQLSVLSSSLLRTCAAIWSAGVAYKVFVILHNQSYVDTPLHKHVRIIWGCRGLLLHASVLGSLHNR